MVFTESPNFPARSAVFAILAGLCLGSFPGWAEESGLSLDRAETVRHALSHNLELQAATHAIAQAKARLRWSGKLAAPEIELSANTDRLGLNEKESVMEIGISRRFPLTDRLSRERDLSHVEVALAEAEVDEARRELIAEVERGFVAALSAREQMKLLTEIRDLMDGFIETLDRQIAQGTVSRLDMNQAKLDRQRIGKDLLRQSSDYQRRLGELKTLAGLSDDASLELKGTLELPAKPAGVPSIEESRARRPDFRLAVLQEDRARAELALAGSQRWEDAVIRLFAEREASVDEPVGRERNTFVGVGISIPLPLKRERATAGKPEAVDQAADQGRAVGLRIENEIASANRRRTEMLEMAREAGGDTLKLAEGNLEEIAKAYQAGQIELFKYQRAQEQLLEARLAALEALTSWHEADIDLREATSAHPEMNLESKGSK